MQWQVDDVMTREVITVGVDAPVGQIASLLDREDISAVPVTAATGGVLGVVSRGDLLRPYARNDAAIRREVEAVLRHRLWIHPEQVGVRVHEGTATLTGTVGRHSTAGIVTRVVTAVPGVTTVVNRIRYDFDDAELVRSTVGRTHPFSAEPFHPGRQRRRGRIRLTSRRRQRQDALAHGSDERRYT
jgi:CBS domain-containing protein